MIDVLIIGAGFSGLACASALREVDSTLQLAVLEARDRVGGRTCNETVSVQGRDVRIDVGGAYVGPTQDRLLRVARSVGVETYKVFVEGESVQALQRNSSASRFASTIPPLGPIGLVDLNRLIVVLDELAHRVPCDEPWKAKDAAQLDQMTVDQWLRANTWSESVYTIGACLVQTVLCKEATQVSLLYWLWYIHSGQGVMRLSDADNGAQERKFVQGASTICERLCEMLGADTVRLNCPVLAVDQRDGSVCVTTASGEQIVAQYVVVALSHALYHKIRFSPPLPQHKVQLSLAPMGSIIKTNMFFEKAYWREQGLNGTILSKEGPISYSYDDCGPESDHPCIMGFVLADHAVKWSQKTPEERQAAIAEQYAQMLGIPALRHPIAFVEKNWNDEEWTGGCYVASMPPNMLSSFGAALREPHDLVHFAGTESAEKWVGYMDGAVEAGERVARELLIRLSEAGRIQGCFSGFRVEQDQDQDVVPRPNHQEKVTWLPGVGGLLAGGVVVVGVVAAAVVRAYKIKR